MGDDLAGYVAQVVRVIEQSGLAHRTNSMFTQIEGEWDDVMDVIKRATFVLTEQDIRTEVVFKADIRPGYTNMLSNKLARLKRAKEEK